MSHKLGVYLAGEHMRPGDYEYIRRLQPGYVRILGPDGELVRRVHEAAPNAKILPRWYEIDDSKGQAMRDIRANPGAAALSHLERMTTELKKLPAGVPYILSHANEPTTWIAEDRPKILTYVGVFLSECAEKDQPATGMCCSNGHPAEWPPDWEYWLPVLYAIKQYPGHLLELHEYWQREGPNYVWTDEKGQERRDWGALAGRHLHVPYEVPILIGECGVEGIIYNRADTNYGWRHYLQPEEYSAQLRVYHAQLGGRVVGILPFLTDYRDNHWASFDTQDAHEHILAWANLETSKPIPETSNPIPSAPVVVQPPAGDNWQRAIEWVLRWEGEFQNDPRDNGNYYEGQLIGTKYGISAAAWAQEYNIPNLTLDEAKHIYFEYYWKESGADQMAWPLCLLAFDTEVLHGEVVQAWIKQVGLNPYAFAAKRLRVYTNSEDWSAFGAAWVNRVADLLKEIGKAI